MRIRDRGLWASRRSNVNLLAGWPAGVPMRSTARPPNRRSNIRSAEVRRSDPRPATRNSYYYDKHTCSWACSTWLVQVSVRWPMTFSMANKWAAASNGLRPEFSKNQDPPSVYTQSNDRGKTKRPSSRRRTRRPTRTCAWRTLPPKPQKRTPPCCRCCRWGRRVTRGK